MRFMMVLTEGEDRVTWDVPLEFKVNLMHFPGPGKYTCLIV